MNLSKAINYSCHDCLTVADAVQYTIAVADPEKVEPRVEELFDTMQAELAAARSTPSLTVAVADIDAVLVQFVDLANSLIAAKDATAEPTTPGAGPPPADLSP